LGHSQEEEGISGRSGYEKQCTELEESVAMLWCNHLWTKQREQNPEREAEEEEEEEEEEILAVIYKNKMNKGYFVYKKENNDQNRE